VDLTGTHIEDVPKMTTKKAHLMSIETHKMLTIKEVQLIPNPSPRSC
jgi:hypothetical protein